MAQQLYLQLHYSGLSPTTDFHSPTTSYRTSSSSLSPSPVMAVGTAFRPTRPEDWEPYRDLIAHLYTTMKLKDVMNEMHSRHNFKATEKQYKTQIKKWNLDTKYTKASEYMAMIKTKRRRENENPPKQTRFILRGRPVDPKDINRFEKRASKKGMMKDEELAYNTKGMIPHNNNHHYGCRQQQVNTFGDEEAEDIEDLVYITPSPSPEPTFSSYAPPPPQTQYQPTDYHQQ
ncbi:Clr5 domain-containing protein [Copromyces sp. CBS 386.78]|nr:Clr5 domain-containing protein [Copromyces sp. CBS 386.78]